MWFVPTTNGRRSMGCKCRAVKCKPPDDSTKTGRNVVGGEKDPASISPMLHTYLKNAAIRSWGTGAQWGSFQAAVKTPATEKTSRQSEEARMVLNGLTGQPDSDKSTICGRGRVRPQRGISFTTDEYVSDELFFRPLP